MIDFDYPAVGRRIAAFRKERGLTAEALAAEVGDPLSREVLAKIETGKRASLDAGTLASIALVLRVPLIALLLDVTRPFDPIAVSGVERSVLEVVSRLEGWMRDPEDWPGLDGLPLPKAAAILRGLERLERDLSRLRAIDWTQDRGNGPGGTLNASGNAELNRAREDVQRSRDERVDYLRTLGVEVETRIIAGYLHPLDPTTPIAGPANPVGRYLPPEFVDDTGPADG
jgi:transcriptional regulator with XRE-family HTH domain